MVDPADAGGVRPERRRHAVRQAPRGRVEIFEHARARPIDVRAVLEDHVDERHAEIGEAAHHARFRHGEHGGGQRIGDLVLDHLRRLARIFGVDDDLRIGEVGNGIERQMKNRIESRRDGEHRADHHQHDVARRRGDEASDHCGAPASLRPLSAALRLLSASIRKLAEVTTLSPSRHAVLDLDIAGAAPAELDGARLEPAFALVDDARFAGSPLSMTALSGTASTVLPLPVSISASAYMSGSRTWSGLGSSMRTRTVRVAGLRCG